MTAGVHFEEDGIVMTDFNMPRILKMGFDAEVLRFGKIFSYRDVLPVMIKIRDDLGGRVTARGSIRKRLTREDKLRLKKGADHASRILRKAGAKDIYRSWVFAAHPGGTVKMGELVDTNLKTRFDGLYVCDCSVMPQELGVPPTFTILALAKRLSGYLLRREAKSGIHDAPESVAVTNPYA
jgi:choline dehydrogenase-like flavoprotein